jgi:uncharacterized protein (DUF1501 family)
MTMDRRKFLQAAALAGMAVMVPKGKTPKANAAVGGYKGPYFLLVHAGGGWDPTMLCDPKGGMINRQFEKGNYGSVAGIKYAPLEYRNSATEAPYYSNDEFFQKWGSRILCINGVDTTTGNHDTGERVMWSGQVAEGYPSLGALIAAAKSPGNSLAFMSGGGYEVTAGLVPLTRVNNIGAFQRIAYPHLINPGQTAQFHTRATEDRIARMQRERLDDLMNHNGLPAYKRTMGALYTSRGGENELELLAKQLPSNDKLNAARYGVHRQGLLALAGFKSGLVISATVSMGGFDTHGNHDADQGRSLANMLRGLDGLFEDARSAEFNNILDNLVVIVGSDFGRTPTYNTQNGKDHWNITSMMMMGPGIRGGRTVGATDENFKAVKINPTTLQPDANGTRIQLEHVHRAVRKLAGLSADPIAGKFPLAGDDLPLLA